MQLRNSCCLDGMRQDYVRMFGRTAEASQILVVLMEVAHLYYKMYKKG